MAFAVFVGSRVHSLATYSLEIVRRLGSSLGEPILLCAGIRRDEISGEEEIIMPRWIGPSGGAFSAITRALFGSAYVNSLARRHKVSIIYSPSHHGSLSPPVPQVVTVHDLIPLRFPAQYRLQHWYYKYLLPRLLAASAAVIVNSSFTAQEVASQYRVPPEKVSVVYPGVAHHVFSPGHHSPPEFQNGYFLVVGPTFGHKNTESVVRALFEVRRELSGLRLKVCGGWPAYLRRLEAMVSELNLDRAVEFLGHVPLQRLVDLYHGAIALVYPSLYEGFGLPPLEAMACGCPVIASNAASLPEVCGDAALLVDPLDVREIASAMIRLATDPGLWQSLRERGLARASQFNWEKTAAGVAAVLMRVVGD
jgi:glycosyltransferase involved in cell wall biosynthesis